MSKKAEAGEDQEVQAPAQEDAGGALTATMEPGQDTTKTHVRMGDRMIERGYITAAQLSECLRLQKSSPGEKLGQVLVRKGYASEPQVMECLASEYGLPFVHVSVESLPPKAEEILPLDFCKHYQVLVVEASDDEMTVATPDAANVFLMDELRRRTDRKVKLAVACASEIKKVLDEISASLTGFDLDELIEDLRDESVVVLEETESEEPTDLTLMSGDSPIVRLMNYLICNAVKQGASDIHIEPGEKRMKIRYRIDGALFELMSPPQHMHAALISRLKIMSNLDISERRLPQDGRIRAVVQNRYLDFRINTLPTTSGEKAVIRILDNRSILIGLERLGFGPDHLTTFKNEIKRTNGIILVTGPTGSGKTTTLYSAILTMNSSEMNISTVEDPVEYYLGFANQVQVKERIGFTFATALRALLRQDPDIIMVGEIRDEETARISVQAALTGHLVLSTLHTNDAPSSITRLINIGIEPYLISAAVNAVFAQRLVRRICDNCKEEYTMSDDMRKALEGKNIFVEHPLRGKGCDECRNTGYRGRCGIYEMLLMDEPLRDLVATNPSLGAIRRHIRQKGMITLRDDGLRKVREGITSIEELMRVTEDVPTEDEGDG